MNDYIVSFSAHDRTMVREVSARHLEDVELFACKTLAREHWPVPTTYKIYKYDRTVIDGNGEVKPRGRKDLLVERKQ